MIDVLGRNCDANLRRTAKIKRRVGLLDSSEKIPGSPHLEILAFIVDLSGAGKQGSPNLQKFVREFIA